MISILVTPRVSALAGCDRNTEEKKYILSLYKIHAEEFPKPDLEEKLNRWVRKEFKTFNEDTRLSIQHWKDSCHKRVYKQNQKKVRKNLEDYYSNHKITEVVKIITDQPYGLDFMEQILVMRANNKLDSFSNVDFKYLNKNDIEDLYYLSRSKEIDNRKVKLINSLITVSKTVMLIFVGSISHNLEISKTAMFSIGDGQARDWMVILLIFFKEVVSDNQSAFVLGRRIFDNILLTRELMYAYHRDIDPPRDSLEEFTRVSGLVPSLPKSTTFFCNVANHVKLSILHTMPFSEGKLSVIYLGVPLIPTRLFNRDCKFLVEKARNRMLDGRINPGSICGRLQLCSSVISSMHVYWASVLMTPTGILLDIEQLMRGFLWCNGDLKRGKAKVAWNTICLRKCEGGLGILSLEVFNIALMTTHIWNIVSNKESLWVRWINAYKLKGRSFWDVPLKNYASWGWRKLIRIRNLVRPFFYGQVSNGHVLKPRTSYGSGTWVHGQSIRHLAGMDAVPSRHVEGHDAVLKIYKSNIDVH
ncbi:hypothetical protein Tco_0321184 [Tanacetum coccineum]